MIRNNSPWFNSSHTIHDLNKRNNIVRNNFKFPALVEKLNRNVDVSKELDTAVYLDNPELPGDFLRMATDSLKLMS